MIEFRVDGMRCGSCVRTVTRAVRSVDLAANVAVDLETKRVRIDSQRSVEVLGAALAGAGFPVSTTSEAAPAAAPRKKGGCCCAA